MTMMPEVCTSWATGGCGSLLELAMVRIVVKCRWRVSRHSPKSQLNRGKLAAALSGVAL